MVFSSTLDSLFKKKTAGKQLKKKNARPTSRPSVLCSRQMKKKGNKAHHPKALTKTHKNKTKNRKKNVLHTVQTQHDDRT